MTMLPAHRARLAARAFISMAAIALAALTAAVAVVPTSEAVAARRRAPSPYDGYVTTESRWGHGTASGPVRRGKWGWQVRLPGGTWVDCVRNNCSETLRLQALDMFESMGRDAIDGGPNYFHWERRF
jgi:hypothetical protein